MKMFVPASKAQDLSAAFFALSRPTAVRTPGEVTQFLCLVKQDLLGDWWVVLDDQRAVRVHKRADLKEIAPLVQPLISAGALAVDTLSILQGRLDAGRGRNINVFDSLPDEIKALALDERQMVEAGRLPPPPTL
jgi:hypothetical protein